MRALLRTVLQILTTTRREILAGAKPYWYDNSAIEDGKTGNRCDEDAEIAIKTAASLEYRHCRWDWMCLECVGMNGTQRKLNGLADEETIEQIPKEFEEVVGSSSNIGCL